MPNIINIRQIAKELNLWNIARGYVDLDNRKLSNLDYLEQVLSEELKTRQNHKILKLKKASKLPYLILEEKKLSDGLKWHYKKLLQLRWVDEEQNIIIIGKCATGKTSLATSLASEAIARNHKVYYCNIENFLEITKNKEINPKHKSTYKYMKECDVIIIDDLFYTGLKDEEMQQLYRSITFLNETRSLILISNRDLSDWHNICKDKHLANTFLERMSINSQIVKMY